MCKYIKKNILNIFKKINFYFYKKFTFNKLNFTVSLLVLLLKNTDFFIIIAKLIINLTQQSFY